MYIYTICPFSLVKMSLLKCRNELAIVQKALL